MLGAHGVELDVRRASDGRLLVRHDPLPVEPAELAELAELASVATLRQALDWCGDLLVNVEIKNSVGDPDRDASLSVVDDVTAELRSRGTDDRWLISSFDARTVEQCRVVAPTIRTALLVEDLSEPDIDAAAQAGHAAIHPWHRSVTLALVERAHLEGLAVNVWTCNAPDEISHLAALGVDGVCTDVPDVALDVLGRDGAQASASPVRWP